MSIVVAYKYAANPQDTTVGSDGVVDWSRAKAAVSEYDPVAIQVARTVADAKGEELVGISVGDAQVSSSMAKKAALSRGFDRALVVADDAVRDLNATAVAGALAALVRKVEGANILLTGDSSIDESVQDDVCSGRRLPGMALLPGGFPRSRPTEMGGPSRRLPPLEPERLMSTGPVVVAVTDRLLRPSRFPA